jgi:LmbE family N-acetylglucosaminyl deacetylase
MSNKVELVRLVGTERRVGETLESVSKHWQGDKECFLMISPHDDDVVLGAGLLTQIAMREKVPVYILIVTDGRMGYCSSKEKDGISEIRKKETFECYQSLGIPKENIIWMGYPDSMLNHYRGRSYSEADSARAISGYTGLQNSFTYFLRKIRPTQCFIPTSQDLHPDHRIVFEEFLISCFHAAGDIWPELGGKIDAVPYLNELAIYCDFPVPPTLRIMTPEALLDKKLEAIGAFRSQKQISALIKNVKASGPQEYIRNLEFRLYHPSAYHNMFEKKASIGAFR